MDYHKNARTTVWSRERMARQVIGGECTLAAAAAAANVSPKTAAKWVSRFRQLGAAGLADRTCRPHRFRKPTRPEQAELVLALRRQRWTGLRIARQTELSRATVSRILRRSKLSRICDLEPRPPVVRYEHLHPGDLLHLDIKKLGRIAKPGHRVTGNPADRTRRVGWEYLHVAIDDHSRVAFSAILPDETALSVADFLAQAMAYYRRFGINVRRIRTAMEEWAYARTYQNSAERSAQLLPWIHEYNWHRPHAGINHHTPISRAGLDRNNLLTLHN